MADRGGVGAARPNAEQIAGVVADIQAGRTHHPGANNEPGIILSLKMLERARRPQPVVDCTAVFHAQRVAASVDLYDDHPSITPPWDDAMLCYVNTFGNVLCLQVNRRDWASSAPPRDWRTVNDVDWARVRWIAETAIWLGGVTGDGSPLTTSGPCHMFRHAIHDDGSPADITWRALIPQRAQPDDDEDPNLATWQAALITLGGALSFLNCSNVDVAEPDRPRPERRRIARTGVTVQTIVVRPPGRHRTRSADPRPIDASETPVSPVRGHFSHYGAQYNRGLLFGKYAGKFWIPSHARGAKEDPKAPEPKTYVLKP